MSDFDAGRCKECGDNCLRFSDYCEACWTINKLQAKIAEARIWNLAISEAAQLVHDKDREQAEKLRELKKNATKVIADL